MTKILLSFFSLVLLSRGAAAHHVYGIEVSPAFELFHGLAEPFLFALSAASLAVFLSQRTVGRFWATLVFSSVALALALASVLEEGAGLFLLWDALAGALFFALVKRGLQRKRYAKHF